MVNFLTTRHTIYLILTLPLAKATFPYFDTISIQKNINLCKIRFKASLLSPALGINPRTSIVEIESDPFLMKNSILIDNRNVNENTSSLVDQSLPPNIIPITFRTLNSINLQIMNLL